MADVKKRAVHYVGYVNHDAIPANTAPPLGRPRLLHDDTVLDAALKAFAIHGYDGMSLRMLNRQLGLSHATINHRFGSKDALYTAAIEHGFRGLLDDLRSVVARANPPGDPLEELRWRFRAFLLASSRRPHLGRLLNNEGLASSPRLDHIFERFIEPAMRITNDLLVRLTRDGVVSPPSPRVVFFVLIHGGAMTFTLDGLSAKFDSVCGPTDAETLATEVANFLIRGLLRPGH